MDATATRTARRRARLERVLEYIDTHLGEPLSIEALARLARISPFHFQRLFATHVGETASGYVRRRALEQAARALILGRARVTECAFDAGYASASAFSRAFHRHFGLTPRALSKQPLARSAPGLIEPVGTLEQRVLPALRLTVARGWGEAAETWPRTWSVLERTIAERHVDARSLPRYGLPTDGSHLVAGGRRRFEAGIAADLPPTGDLLARCIPAGRYAVFRYRGGLAGLQAAHDAVLWRLACNPSVPLAGLPALHRVLGSLHGVDADSLIEAEILHPMGIVEGARPERMTLSRDAALGNSAGTG